MGWGALLVVAAVAALGALGAAAPGVVDGGSGAVLRACAGSGSRPAMHGAQPRTGACGHAGSEGGGEELLTDTCVLSSLLELQRAAWLQRLLLEASARAYGLGTCPPACSEGAQHMSLLDLQQLMLDAVIDQPQGGGVHSQEDVQGQEQAVLAWMGAVQEVCSRGSAVLRAFGVPVL